MEIYKNNDRLHFYFNSLCLIFGINKNNNYYFIYWDKLNSKHYLNVGGKTKKLRLNYLLNCANIKIHKIVFDDDDNSFIAITQYEANFKPSLFVFKNCKKVLAISDAIFLDLNYDNKGNAITCLCFPLFERTINIYKNDKFIRYFCFNRR